MVAHYLTLDMLNDRSRVRVHRLGDLPDFLTDGASLDSAAADSGCAKISGALASRAALRSCLGRQTTLRADGLFTAAQQQFLAFDDVYAQLRKVRTGRGPSNSEAALAAGPWA